MLGSDIFETLFVLSAFLFQAILIIHFALRKWHFDRAMRYGRIVYALSFPALVISIFILTGGKPWSFWLGGFIYFIWSIFGYTVEYVKRLEWRSPARWSVLAPYVTLYLATVMFYWWPLALIYKPLWYGYTLLFIISTFLNVTSHKRSDRLIPNEAIK